MSTLRQVLEVFRDGSQPLTMNQIARQLDVEPSMLEDMIAFWVRKGKLRDVSACAERCGTCGIGSAGCPFVMQMPRRYELSVRLADSLSMVTICEENASLCEAKRCG